MKQVIFSIKENKEIAKNTYKMVLSGDTSGIGGCGQFVNIALEGLYLRRPISVFDCEAGLLSIIYKVVGKGTAQMAKMSAGETLDVLTGLGNGYDLTKAGNKPLLIGGGAGVPPMYQLAKELIKEGKKAAIVSTAKDSISLIFLEREMDYYIYDSVDEVNEKALSLIDEDNYDLIVIYNGNYDGTMHKFGPEAPESFKALEDNIRFYCKLVNDIREKWKAHNVFYGFMTDHGCHEIDGECGSHGLDMEEDMNVIHFYGVKEKEA